MIFTLLAGCVGVVYAEGDTDAAPEVELVYEMSLEGSEVDTGNGQELVVTDKSGAGYVSTHDISSNEPAVKETGFNGHKYLEFAYMPTTDQNGDGSIDRRDLMETNRSLKVKFKRNNAQGIDKGGEIADFEGMTIEMWTRINPIVKLYSNIFAFGPNGKAVGNGVFSAQANSGSTNPGASGGSLEFYIDRAVAKDNGFVSATFDSTAATEDWAHIVITREWIEQTAPVYGDNGKVETQGSGQWKMNVYIDGVRLKGTGLNVATPGDKTDRLTYKGGYVPGKAGTNYKYNKDNDGTSYADTFAIGGDLQGNAFACDIGGFKIYKGIKTDEEVAKTYARERAGYMAVPDATPETIDTLKALGRDDDEFEIAFSYDVDPETLSAESVYLEDENGNKINATYKGYSDKKATFELNDFLRYSTKYYLNLVGVKDLNGGDVARDRIEFVSAPKKNLEVKDVSIEGSEDGKTFSGDEAKFILKVKNTDDTENIRVGMMVMIYKDGRAIMPIKTELQELNPGTEGTLTVSTKDNQSGIVLGEGYTVRSFAYSEENGYIGFSTPIELSYAQ